MQHSPVPDLELIYCAVRLFVNVEETCRRLARTCKLLHFSTMDEIVIMRDITATVEDLVDRGVLMLVREIARQYYPSGAVRRCGAARTHVEAARHVIDGWRGERGRLWGVHMSVLAYAPEQVWCSIARHVVDDVDSAWSEHRNVTGIAPLVLDRVVIELEPKTDTVTRDEAVQECKLIVRAVERELNAVPIVWHSGAKSLYIMTYLEEPIVTWSDVVYSGAVRYLLHLVISRLGRRPRKMLPKLLDESYIVDVKHMFRLPYTYRDVGTPCIVDPHSFEEVWRVNDLPRLEDAYVRICMSELLSELEIVILEEARRRARVLAELQGRIRRALAERREVQGYGYVRWLLEHATLPDWKKRVLVSIIVPYLCNVAKLEMEEAWENIVRPWLLRQGVEEMELEEYYKVFKYNWRHVERRGILPPSLRTVLDPASKICTKFALQDFSQWLLENYVKGRNVDASVTGR